MFEKIEIKWDDAVSDTSGWHYLDEFDFDYFEDAQNHQTIGYFLRKTQESIFICQSYRDGGDTGEKTSIDGVFIIPFPCVKSVRKL